MSPLPLNSHSYWGRRAGTNHPSLGRIIPGKRASNTAHKHSGPHRDWQLRFRWPMQIGRMGTGNATRLLRARGVS